MSLITPSTARFDATFVSTLKLEQFRAHTRITSGAPGNAGIRLVAGDGSELNDALIDIQDDTLIIRQPKRKAEWEVVNVRSGGISISTAIRRLPTVEIVVPKGTNVVLEAVVGDVEVRGLNARLDVATKSGDVTALDVVDASITTKSGGIKLDGVAGKVVFSSNGSGDLEITNADLDSLKLVTSGSGDMDIQGHIASLTLDKSGSGDLEINGQLGRVVGLHGELPRISGSGDVEITGQLGDQVTKRNLKRFKTGSGDLDVDRIGPYVKPTHRTVRVTSTVYRDEASAQYVALTKPTPIFAVPPLFSTASDHHRSVSDIKLAALKATGLDRRLDDPITGYALFTSASISRVTQLIIDYGEVARAVEKSDSIEATRNSRQTADNIAARIDNQLAVLAVAQFMTSPERIPEAMKVTFDQSWVPADMRILRSVGLSVVTEMELRKLQSSEARALSDDNALRTFENAVLRGINDGRQSVGMNPLESVPQLEQLRAPTRDFGIGAPEL